MATEDRVDTERVLALFCQCRQGDNSILTDGYANAYQETSKMLRLFGTVFGFVSSEIEDRIRTLRDCRQSEAADMYMTVQSMLEYEVAGELTGSGNRTSGARNLLPLHRALEFIIALLIKLRDCDNDANFSKEATEVYEATVAKHYSWFVNKGVRVAMMMLPTRPELLRKMNLDDTGTEEKMALLTRLIDELLIIYNITQDLYAKDNLLNLNVDF